MFDHGFPSDWSTLKKLIWIVKSTGGGGQIPGYKVLDFIHFGGNAYINTGCAISLEHSWEAKWRKTNSSAAYLYGYANSGNTITTTAYLTSSGANWRFGSKTTSIAVSPDIWYESTQNKSGVTINGETNTYDSQSSFSSTYNMYFGINRTSNGSIGTSYFIGDVAYCKVKNGDKTIREFIPVKRISDNVYGFYDKVGKQFYPSLGDPFTGSDSPIADIGTADNMILLDSDAEITPNATQSLNMLLGGMYTNNHTADDVSDEEALNIILGGDNA